MIRDMVTDTDVYLMVWKLFLLLLCCHTEYQFDYFSLTEEKFSSDRKLNKMKNELCL